MIMLKSINGSEFCLNSDLIYKIEQAPDTIITLVDGKKLRVADEIQDIVSKIILFKKQIYSGPMEV
ncbi:MAG: flagellar FlbD family protein [Eubacteriales bacterium]